MKLSKKLKIIRKQRGYTLKTLSQKTGLSVSFLSDVERGVTLPSLTTAQKIVDAYGMSLSWLFSGVEIFDE